MIYCDEKNIYAQDALKIQTNSQNAYISIRFHPDYESDGSLPKHYHYTISESKILLKGINQ